MTACSKKSAPADDAPTPGGATKSGGAAPAPSFELPEIDPPDAAPKPQDQVDDGTKLLLAAKTPADRLKAFRDVAAGLAQLKSVKAPYDSPGLTHARELLASLDKIQAEDDAEKKTLPEIPDEPKHEPPKYKGAFELSGPIRKCYKDGVVIEARGKFYFVRDAKCPDVDYLHGWVDDVDDTIKVDIGRDGRDAEIVTIADKESANDDREAHRKELAEYEADYQAKLAARRKALSDNAAILAPYQKHAVEREARAKPIRATLDAQLVVVTTGGKLVPDCTVVPDVVPPTPPPAARRKSNGLFTDGN